MASRSGWVVPLELVIPGGSSLATSTSIPNCAMGVILVVSTMGYVGQDGSGAVPVGEPHLELDPGYDVVFIIGESHQVSSQGLLGHVSDGLPVEYQVWCVQVHFVKVEPEGRAGQQEVHSTVPVVGVLHELVQVVVLEEVIKDIFPESPVDLVSLGFLEVYLHLQ